MEQIPQQVKPEWEIENEARIMLQQYKGTDKANYYNWHYFKSLNTNNHEKKKKIIQKKEPKKKIGIQQNLFS